MISIVSTHVYYIPLQNHGLRDLPTATYRDRKEGVTLKCTREQEAQAYVYFEDGFDSLDRLKDICGFSIMLVHTILGAEIDLVCVCCSI